MLDSNHIKFHRLCSLSFPHAAQVLAARNRLKDCFVPNEKCANLLRAVGFQKNLMKVLREVRVVKQRKIEEDKSLSPLHRQLEQFSELVLLFILDVIKARNAKKSNPSAISPKQGIAFGATFKYDPGQEKE